MIVRKVSEAVIRRLPKYYRQLIALQAAGVERISADAAQRVPGAAGF